MIATTKTLSLPMSSLRLALLTLTAMVLTALWSSSVQAESLPQVRIITSEGLIEVRLRPDVAPKSVENFLRYVNQGFYDGTIFHRVIPGFMIQGGGFEPGLKRKQTEDPVVNEASPTLKNLRGSLAMARTSDPDSATSQFFINLSDNDFLNAGVRGPGYTVFGTVTEGMGVVDAIAGVSTERRQGMADVPARPVVIERIERLEQD